MRFEGGTFSVSTALLGTTVVSLTILWYLQRSRKQSGAESRTQFSAFLIKETAPTRQPSQFSSFLKSATAAATTENRETEREVIPDDALCVPILYGTEYGFSKEIAETLATQMKAVSPYWPVVLNMADFPKGLNLTQEQILVFVCSTQGDGVPPYEARAFCEWLRDSPSVGDLSSLYFTVCALGDRSYAHFCRCGKKIRSTMKKKGAQEITKSVKVDKEDWTAIQKWISELLEKLPELDLSPDRTQLKDVSVVERDAEDGWTKSRPFLARIVDRYNLCQIAEENDKTTMHIELDIEGSGLSYLPGDAVGIYPQNPPDDVETLLRLIGATGDEEVTRPSWAPKLPKQTIQMTTLKEALVHFYDLRNPKVKLFGLILAHLNSKEGSKPGQTGEKGLNSAAVHDSGQSIHHMADETSLREQKLETLMQDAHEREQYQDSRHVLDILLDFKAPHLPVREFLEGLRPLQPRLYSVSSSFLHSPTLLSITVAEVKYSTHGRARRGIASTFLTERVELGETVPIYISSNPDFRLPPSLTTPIIMVGPGTGLAPFRSFILEKLRIAESDAVGVSLLFFGCRNREQDYLYGDTLEDWNQRGIIQLHTAFSREQVEKVYVQQRLWENGEAIWKLLQEGSHFYVCGDAQYMAPDVEHCLLKIMKLHGALSETQAEEFLHTLSQNGRYQRDVWF